MPPGLNGMPPGLNGAPTGAARPIAGAPAGGLLGLVKPASIPLP